MGVGKRIWLLLLALVLCLSLPSCKAQSQPYRIFVIARPGNADFYRVVRSGALTAGRQNNVEIQYYEPEKDEDCSRRVKWIDEAVEKGIDAIVLADSKNEKLHQAVERAKRAGVVMVAVDAAENDSLYACSTGTDHFAAGRELGMHLDAYRRTPKNTRVGLLTGRENAAAVEQRRAGFEQAIKELGGIEVSWTETCDDGVQAYQRMKEHLEIGDVDVVVSLSMETSLGAAQAVKALSSSLPLLGFYGSTQEVTYLEEGLIREAVVQNPFAMGYLSVDAAVRCLEGKPVEKWISANYILVNPDNIFEEENQGLVFPFLRDGD